MHFFSRDDAISRRTFCAAALSTAAGAAVAAIARGDEGEGDAPPEGRYFDMHTHLGQTWNSRPPLTAEALLRWMDAHEIARAVVLPLINPEASSYPLTTDFVLAQTKPYRDRLVPFCSIDPRTSYRGGHKGLVEMLLRYKEAGARGFGEHKPGIPVDDARNMAIYAACAEAKLPLLFHLDNQRNTDKPGLPGLEKAVKEHPECTFIGHGPGWWASISGDATQADLGGYPRGKTAPGGAIDRLMEKYPNIYGELSAGSGANSINRDIEFGGEFLIRRADRILFGTDYLAPEQNVPQFELFDKIELPGEVRQKIERGNARKLLGIAG